MFDPLIYENLKPVLTRMGNGLLSEVEKLKNTVKDFFNNFIWVFSLAINLFTSEFLMNYIRVFKFLQKDDKVKVKPQMLGNNITQILNAILTRKYALNRQKQN